VALLRVNPGTSGLILIGVENRFQPREDWGLSSRAERREVAGGRIIVGRLTRSLPLTRSRDLPVDVARLPPAPFSETPRRLTPYNLH
jgi:hypothetical protein